MSELGRGQVFAGDFRVVERLGRGGMGVVYVAEQLSTGHRRALKVMHPWLADDLTARARFVQEARVGARIASEHVVEVVAAGFDEPTRMLWLAMELLEGEDLARWRALHPAADLQDLRRIFAELGHAMGAAHAAGIVHRDLKPENVFVSRARRVGTTFTVKVLDFGIARVLTEGRVTGTQAMGTPLWMAPEQTEPDAPVGPAADVWALGLLGFFVLVGRPYWRSARSGAWSVSALLREVVIEPLVPASVRARELGAEPPPEPFDAWFATTVVRDPAQRLQDGRAAAEALDAVLLRVMAHRVARVDAPPAPTPSEPRGMEVFATTQAAPLGPPRASPSGQRPGDRHVRRALEAYECFYNERAYAALRAALKVDPSHPRALACVVLCEGATKEELDASVGALASLSPAEAGDDAELVAAAHRLATQGPLAARDALKDLSREDHVFWRTELAYRAGLFREAVEGYRAILASASTTLLGRVFDHGAATFLHLDAVSEAVAVARRYAESFPDEADALGVYATALAVAGETDRALALAREALSLHEHEDTYAGLAKVHALRGELALAEQAYGESLERCGEARRPLRRAGQGMVRLLWGDPAGALSAVAPCLPGGAEEGSQAVAPALLVAALANPACAEDQAVRIERHTRALRKAHRVRGQPERLAALARAVALVGAGPLATVETDEDRAARALSLLGTEPVGDFVAGYHVPFASALPTVVCAEAMRALGEDDNAAALVDARLSVLPSNALLLSERVRLGGEGGALAREALAKAWAGCDRDAVLAHVLR